MRKLVNRSLLRLGTPILLASAMMVSVLGFSANPADAAACAANTPVASCSMTGTLTLTGGNLTITPPTSLTWTAAQTGLNLNVVDTTAADQGYTVSDATGTGAGWHVTVAATQFTTGTNTLSNTGTFSTNGSTSSVTASTAPTAACVTVGQCTVPTDTTTYPVAITTAASSPTPVTVFDTSASTGIGSIAIGSVGWWLSIPATAYAGTYTSTITVAVVAAP